MNRYQMLVCQAQLENEDKCRQQLVENYKQALTDVRKKVKQVLKEQKEENTQSYLRYQLQLEKQLESILYQLGEKNVSDTTKYLNSMYKEGYIGCVYAMHKEGVDLLLQIDEKKVRSVVFADTKGLNFSKRLYKNLDKLKRDFKFELARGFSNGSDYLAMAANLARYGEADLKRAFRLIKTEGHRVQEQSKLDAMFDAKDCGADVVKEWDSTLDSLTRDTHVELDGQIREVEDEYEIPSTGFTAMYPGGFGIAEEDIHCRCISLQRAKWNLDNEEYKYSRYSDEIVSIKSDDYIKWKEKYNEKSLEKAAKDGSITDKDKKAIYDYMSFESYIINEALRSDTPLTDEQKIFVESLDIALSKMPVYSGNLSRSLEFWDKDVMQEFVNGFQEDSHIIFSEYISTTKGEIYNPDGQVQIFINNANKGKDISGFNEKEQEVLYNRNTEFKVLKVIQVDSKVYIILEEKIE